MKGADNFPRKASSRHPHLTCAQIITNSRERDYINTHNLTYHNTTTNYQKKAYLLASVKEDDTFVQRKVAIASVWRCYGDRIVQVAEFVDAAIATYQFAWVIVYLSGAYGSRGNGGGTSMLNLEVNGPGTAVLNEIQNMKKQRYQEASRGDRSLMDVMGNMSDYLYRKYDSIYGSMSALHTVTTFQMKERMMNVYRDYFERGMLVPRSHELVEEMKSVVRDEGSAPAAPSGQHDDRVIAACLACLAYNDALRQSLLSRGFNYDYVHKEVKETMEEPIARSVQKFMREIGYLQEVRVQKKNTGVGKFRKGLH